jgi:hypothetical protein
MEGVTVADIKNQRTDKQKCRTSLDARNVRLDETLGTAVTAVIHFNLRRHIRRPD